MSGIVFKNLLLSCIIINDSQREIFLLITIDNYYTMNAFKLLDNFKYSAIFILSTIIINEINLFEKILSLEVS